jgi:hypothetical protein
MHLPDKKFELQHVVDSLATISDIIFRRFKCMECNQCEPCGPIFMQALNTLREAGNIAKGGGPAGGPGGAGGQK